MSVPPWTANVAIAQGASSAANAVRDFSIPAQPLARALNALGRQSGLQVVLDADTSQGISSRSISGRYTPSQALGRMLAGSSLSYRITADGTAVIGQNSTASGNFADDGSLLLDTINVTSGGGESAGADAQYRSPASSSHISREEIERFRGTSPGDFLEGNPGVLVGAKRTSGAVDVNIRGMQGMDRVPVTVDGAQQSNTVWRGYAGVATRTYIDPDFLSEVKIDKGPTLSADGAGATGGAVRMSTIDADDILLDGRNAGVRLRGGMVGNTTTPPPHGTRGGIDDSLMNQTYSHGSLPGSFGFTDGLDRPGFLDPTSGHGSIAVAARDENVEAVAAYARRSLGNYYAGSNGDDAGHVVLTPDGSGTHAERAGLTHFQAGEEVLNTANESTSYLVKGVLKGDNNHRLELAYTKYMSEYFEMFPSQVTRFGGPYQEMPSNIELDTYTASHTWKPDGNDLIDLTANLWMTDIQFQIGQSAPTIFPGNPFLKFTNDVDAVRWGVNLSNTSRFDTSYGEWKFDYGFSYTDEEMVQGGTSEALVLPPPLPTIPADEGVGKAGNRQEWSLFAGAQWRPRDWLTLDAGLRYTNTKSHDECLVSGRATCRNMANDGFAPILAATVEPWDGIQLYGRYAEAIRSASLYESTRGESFNDIAFDLVPEHAKNWEFGFNVLRDDVLVSGDSFRFKAAYFDNNIDDYLTRTDNSPGSSIGNFAMRNLDYARFKGFEISGSYDTGGLFAELGYTRYLHTEFCLDPEDAALYDNVACNPAGVYGGYAQLHVPPEQMASLTLGARLFDEALTVGGRFSYFGARPEEDIGSGGGWTALTEWNPYTLIDLFASWQINENVEAKLAVDNLTDIYYVDALAMGLVPAPGRTFRASLTAKF